MIGIFIINFVENCIRFQTVQCMYEMCSGRICVLSDEIMLMDL